MKEQVEELLRSLNNFSLSVEATPMVLRQQRVTNSKPMMHHRSPMQPRGILVDQTNQQYQVNNDNPYPNVFESPIKQSGTQSQSAQNHVNEQAKIKNMNIPPHHHRTTKDADDWVETMRHAVHEWMEKQRQVIACERSQVTQQLESYQHALVVLQGKYDKLQAEHKHGLVQHERMQEQLRQVMDYQQSRIEQLESQLKSRQVNIPPYAQDSAKEVEDLTPHPQPALGAENSAALNTVPAANKDNKRRIKRTRTINEQGHVVTHYSNGAEKELRSDGTTVIRFANGDIQTNASDGSTAYYYAASDVYKSTHPQDGSIVYKFSNGQIERHFPDGRKLVDLPDGTRVWADQEQAWYNEIAIKRMDVSLLSTRGGDFEDKYAV
jgi:hypothetical protein